MIINLIGMGKGRRQAPEGVRWGLTRIVHEMRVDVLFDMHNPGLLADKPLGLFCERKAKAKEMGVKFYSCENYPIDEIMAHFNTNFFADSISYALAMAIYQGATEIHLYGINQAKAFEAEYHHHKPCTEYWIGLARGMGIKCEIHGPSEVCKTKDGKLYGYGYVGNIQKQSD